jgi:hypothetical protein
VTKGKETAKPKTPVKEPVEKKVKGKKVKK